MDYRLEPLGLDHVADTVAIWQAGWHEAHADLVPESLRKLRTTDDFLARLRANATGTRIALRREKVLGFCIVKADELYQLYLDPAARGLGVAQALVKDAEATMRANGHTVGWLACAVGNARAMRFYEKAGWVNAGQQTVALDTSDGSFPLSVWRYEKNLAQSTAD